MYNADVDGLGTRSVGGGRVDTVGQFWMKYTDDGRLNAHTQPAHAPPHVSAVMLCAVLFEHLSGLDAAFPSELTMVIPGCVADDTAVHGTCRRW